MFVTMFMLSFVSAVTLSFASDAGKAGAAAFISCASPENATLTGMLDEKSGALLLGDPAHSLYLNPLTRLPAQFSFKRRLRVHEQQYSFAKFSCDATAWENLEISLPRSVLSGETPREFPAYLTVYTDDGNGMAPGREVRLACTAKKGRDKLFTDCSFQTDCPANEGCNKHGKCEYNSFIPAGEGNNCFTDRQCHNGNTCRNGHCEGLW
jgi:hypothetical protein